MPFCVIDHQSVRNLATDVVKWSHVWGGGHIAFRQSSVDVFACQLYRCPENISSERTLMFDDAFSYHLLADVFVPHC